MTGLVWYKPENFPEDYDGIVIVSHEETMGENHYGTYKFWPGKGIWVLSERKINYMAAINEPGVERSE